MQAKKKQHPQGRKKIDENYDTVIIGFRGSSLLKTRFLSATAKMGLTPSDVLRVLVKDFVKKIEGI